MSDNANNTIDNLEDALAALDKVRKADAAKRKRIDALEEQIEATDGKLAALTAYEALGTPDDLKARLTSGDAALKALTDNGVTPEELPSIVKEAKDGKDTRTKLTYIEAAGSEYDPAKLQKIAPGLTAREIEKDGQKVTEYGIPGEGDAWTPLADAVSGWEASLKRDTAPKPTPAPLPTGGAGGKPTPENPVQARIKARQEAQTAPTDPFKPHTGGNS